MALVRVACHNPHGGKYRGLGARGVPQQLHLVFEAVDSIDDVVECVQLEFVRIRFFVDILESYDVGVRVDFEQTIFQHVHLDLPHGFRSGHQLAVHVGDAHAVRIDKHELLDAGTHEAFGAPTADSSEPEDDDALLVDVAHHVVSEQERCAVKDTFLDSHMSPG